MPTASAIAAAAITAKLNLFEAAKQVERFSVCDSCGNFDFKMCTV